MVKLTSWKEHEMTKWRRDIDHLFSRFWSDYGIRLFAGQITQSPTVDISETDDTLVVKVELPETKPEDLDISVDDDILTISGEKRSDSLEENNNHFRVEKRVGSFSRTVSLPCKVDSDNTRATYQKGILKIVMPKLKVKKSRGVKIEVM